MGTKTNYYQILGVTRGASDAKIKTAWKEMAKKLHPDKNPDDPKAEEAFKELGEAWEVLSDPKRRAVYDRFGHEGIGPDSRSTSARQNRTRWQGTSLDDLMKDLEEYEKTEVIKEKLYRVKGFMSRRQYTKARSIVTSEFKSSDYDSISAAVMRSMYSKISSQLRFIRSGNEQNLQELEGDILAAKGFAELLGIDNDAIFQKKRWGEAIVNAVGNGTVYWAGVDLQYGGTYDLKKARVFAGRIKDIAEKVGASLEKAYQYAEEEAYQKLERNISSAVSRHYSREVSESLDFISVIFPMLQEGASYTPKKRVEMLMNEHGSRAVERLQRLEGVKDRMYDHEKTELQTIKAKFEEVYKAL